MDNCILDLLLPEIQPLSNAEMKEFIARKWEELALPLSADDGPQQFW
jgi:hypothetical protein